MANFQVYGRFSGRFDNTVVQGGTLERPFSFTVGGVKYDQVYSIAASANTTIYNNTLAGDFDFLFIQADFSTRLVFTDTNSNTFALQVKGTGVAERYGIPLMLGLDETTDASNTIATIVAHNDVQTTNTAKVRIFAAT
jgi:hypothetical protein